MPEAEVKSALKKGESLVFERIGPQKVKATFDDGSGRKVETLVEIFRSARDRRPESESVEPSGEGD
jgi:hypothetical protein